MVSSVSTTARQRESNSKPYSISPTALLSRYGGPRLLQILISGADVVHVLLAHAFNVGYAMGLTVLHTSGYKSRAAHELLHPILGY